MLIVDACSSSKPDFFHQCQNVFKTQARIFIKLQYALLIIHYNILKDRWKKLN